MGIRIVKTQLFAALSFALLAGCSTDSGVISKKDRNQQISSSPQSPIQRLADVDSESIAPARHSKKQLTGDIDNHSTHQPTATATPSNDEGVEASALQAKGVEPPIPVTNTPASEAPGPVIHQSSAPTAAELAAAQQDAERLEREAAELAAAQQEAERLEREAAELAAAQQEPSASSVKPPNWLPHNRKPSASSVKPQNWLPHNRRPSASSAKPPNWLPHNRKPSASSRSRRTGCCTTGS